MSGRARLFLAVVAGVVLIVGTTAAFGTVAVLHEGTIAVDVEDGDGTRISLAVPVSFARAVLSVAPAYSAPEMEATLAEVRPHWPLFREACAQLASYPQGVLVEVEGPGEHVVIAKEGDDLVVRIEDGEDRVHVRLPASVVEDAAEAVGRMAGLE